MSIEVKEDHVILEFFLETRLREERRCISVWIDTYAQLLSNPQRSQKLLQISTTTLVLHVNLCKFMHK